MNGVWAAKARCSPFFSFHYYIGIWGLGGCFIKIRWGWNNVSTAASCSKEKRPISNCFVTTAITSCLFLFNGRNLPFMSPSYDAQHDGVVYQEQRSSNDTACRCNHNRHTSSNTILPVLRRIHIHNGRNKTRNAIQQRRQENPMNHPHVVLAMLPPQPQAPRDANATRKGRDVQQRNVAHGFQSRGTEAIVPGLCVGALEFGKCRGEGNVASK